MTWTEIRKWAKEHGYHSVKTDGEYHWHKIDDPSINGVQPSLSKLSKAIYNHMSHNKWVEYQLNFND